MAGAKAAVSCWRSEAIPIQVRTAMGIAASLRSCNDSKPELPHHPIAERSRLSLNEVVTWFTPSYRSAR